MHCRTANIMHDANILNIGGDSSLIQIASHTTVRGELAVLTRSGRITIDKWCYVGQGTRIWAAAHISIGERAMIGHNVSIFDNLTHPISPLDRHNHYKAISTTGHPQDIDLDAKDIEISNDAWIGAGSTIIRGIRIGQGAIIAAGSVVTKDVEDFTVSAGNPSRVVRKLTPSECILPA